MQKGIVTNRQVGMVQPGQVVSGGGAGTGTGTVVKGGGVGVVSGGGGDTSKVIVRKTTILEKKIPVAAEYQTSWDGAATTEAKVDILAQMLGLKL